MWLVIVVSLVVIIVVYYFFIKNKQFKIDGSDLNYKHKDFLLSKTERSVYEFICNFIYENSLKLKVFPKMRLTDFLWSPKDNRNAYLRISGKFIDFLIVDRSGLKPVAAVFIINQENQAKMSSLSIIEPALKSADINLIKIESDLAFNRNRIMLLLQDNLFGGM
jgi:hypothetical protein